MIVTKFSFIISVLTLVFGIMWVLDLLYFSKQRKKAAHAAVLDYDNTLNKDNNNNSNKNNDTVLDNNVLLHNINTQINHDEYKTNLVQYHLQRPWWLEYTAGFFGVTIAVLILRSFVFEPFRIPSQSMEPTLQSGDLILVNKFSWGLRLPITNTKILDTGHPDRGDVIVFRFPVDPSIDFIKRVIGLPGDVIEYKNKVLSINGTIVHTETLPKFLDDKGEVSGSMMTYMNHFIETLPQKNNTRQHHSYNNPLVPSAIFGGKLHSYPESCTYLLDGIRCTVPTNHYFVMGDNRDNSLDSRFWGFVPDENVVGHAFFIWMNLNLKLNRIGSF